jgi:hypothetical protein
VAKGGGVDPASKKGDVKTEEEEAVRSHYLLASDPWTRRLHEQELGNSRYKNSPESSSGGEGKGVAGQPSLPRLPVRVYAHSRRAGATPEMGTDFTETLYWHPVLILPGGRAEVAFDLSDAVTTFEATAFAHTPDGRLGWATRALESRPPISLQPRTPREVTHGDRIDVPVLMTNHTARPLNVQLDLRQHEGLALTGGPARSRVNLPAQAELQKLYSFEPAIRRGEALLHVEGKADTFAPDTVRSAVRVAPEGYPTGGVRGSWLNQPVTQSVVLPPQWVPGTLEVQVHAYPSALAGLRRGLEALAREPGGRAEKAAAAVALNLEVLECLRGQGREAPLAEREARDGLTRAYRDLAAAECRGGGFAWSAGAAPADDAVTAFALAQLHDLARVQTVDAALVRRSQDYLLARTKADAHALWALTEGGAENDLEREGKALREQAREGRDPRFQAAVAQALLDRGRDADAQGLLRAVATAWNKDDGRQVEATAVALLGWLRAGGFDREAERAAAWLNTRRDGAGGFGTPRATALALKALAAHARAHPRTVKAGELQLSVGGKLAARLRVAAGSADALTLSLPDAEKYLRPGANAVRVALTGGNAFPGTLTWSYRTRTPPAPTGCPLRLDARLARPKAAEGDLVRLDVTVENASDKEQGPVVAVVGLPAGLSVSEGDTKGLAPFEVRGRELVLTWRGLTPRQKVTLPVDLVCRVPGSYTGPASRAYLPAAAGPTFWAEPLRMTITPQTR